TILTSACPGRYPRPLLLEESLPVRHAVCTCSGHPTCLGEDVRSYSVPSSHGRIRRAVLSTGFLWQCKPVSVEGCRRPILCLLALRSARGPRSSFDQRVAPRQRPY